MLGVSNEKIKMFKIFHFPCYHGNQNWWGSQVWKKAYFLQFWASTAIPPTYIETYTVNGKF